MQREREGKEMKEMVTFFLFGWHKRKKKKKVWSLQFRHKLREVKMKSAPTIFYFYSVFGWGDNWGNEK